jgi:hypothetical protein
MIFLSMSPTQLGLQVCPTTLGLFVEMGSPLNFLPRLSSNWGSPDLCLPSSEDYRVIISVTGMDHHMGLVVGFVLNLEPHAC